MDVNIMEVDDQQKLLERGNLYRSLCGMNLYLGSGSPWVLQCLSRTTVPMRKLCQTFTQSVQPLCALLSKFHGDHCSPYQVSLT